MKNSRKGFFLIPVRLGKASFKYPKGILKETNRT